MPTGTLDNPNGCWNWSGYLGDTAYAHHGGKQVEAIMNKVRALGGGGTETPAPTSVTPTSVDAQDGYVKAAPDGVPRTAPPRPRPFWTAPAPPSSGCGSPPPPGARRRTPSSPPRPGPR
ncbi:hypothetical protein OG389_00790 [Streptomyces sp. NBC_00435]|uniref:hypothetical protein n=1 Tax=Streptomyces sp. NBC_00435 TaxID=2903649 RepID=UPI002E205D9D